MTETQSTQSAPTSAAPPASSGPQSVAPVREISPATPTPVPVDRLTTLMAGTVEPDAVAPHLPLSPETLAKLSPAEQHRLQETVERRVTEEAQKIAARTIEEASGLDLTRHSDSVGDVRPIPLPAAASTRAAVHDARPALDARVHAAVLELVRKG